MNDRLRDLLAADDQPRRALRLLAGLLLATGMLLVFIRRSGFPDGWGEFPLLLVLLVPCAFLYGAGMIAARQEPLARGWEGVYVVFGLLLMPLVGFQLVELLDGDGGAPLNSVWIFGLTAAAGLAAGLLAGIRFGLLLAALALIVAWLALWDEILSDGVFSDVGTLRGLLVLVALGLAGAGFALGGRDLLPGRGSPGAHDPGAERDFARRGIEPGPGVERMSELVSGAGVAAVAAGAISITAISGRIPFADPPAAEASVLWDTWLLFASLALIGFGAWAASRGPAWVGAFGLLFFVLSVGLDLDDASPAGKLIGWPLIVLVLGLLALIASLAPGLARRLPRGGAPASGPPPGPPPATG